MRALLPVALLALAAGCTDAQSGEDAALLREARTGMNTVRGIPGGKTASFTAVKLVGKDTVCGMIDGNDGDGPRPFSVRGQDVQVADKRDPATAAAIAKACTDTPVYEIRSRNEQFSDLEVVH